MAVAENTPAYVFGHTHTHPVDVLFTRNAARITAGMIDEKSRVGSPPQDSLGAAQFWEPAFPRTQGKRTHVDTGPILFDRPNDPARREVDEVDPREPPNCPLGGGPSKEDLAGDLN